MKTDRVMKTTAPKPVRKALAFVAGAIALAVTALGVRTAFDGLSHAAIEPAGEIAVPEGAAERLAAAVRIPTVSHEDVSASEPEQFRALHAYLSAAFPRVHSHLRREVIAQHSLLYTWQGSNPALKPILLMGHMDVVPVEPNTEDQWKHAPFSGRIADGFVWGRGAIDNKSAVVGILEAAEMLLAEGFRPARTIYVAYGHDEESGGTRGAREIAQLLERRGVRLEMVLDEGGVIGEGVFPGIDRPVALIGIAEKGFVSIELSTYAAGGHSSLPPRDSAVGILAGVVARLERNPMPAELQGPARQLFEHVGPSLPLVQRAVFANLWLTRPFVTRKLERHPTTNAMVRTTSAATMFQAGTKDNVLPSHARAVVNFRIAPNDSIAGVLEHVRRVVNDTRVQIRIAGAFSAEPSSVSDPQSPGYRNLERAVRSVLGDVIVAPYPVVVATDSRHFAGIATNVFRLLPLRLTARDLERIHGKDERVSVRDYEQAILIYRHLILNSAAL